MRFRRVCLTGLLSCLMIGVINQPVYAQVIPPLPQTFYGNVQINGQPAPVKTRIEARGQNVTRGVEGNPLITSVAGSYGASGSMDERLIVQGNISSGSTIDFYVSGIKADQTSAFSSGEVTNLNLTATGTPRYFLDYSVNPPGGGSVSLNPAQPNPGQPDEGYTAGTVVTLTATPNPGYVFANWSGDASGANLQTSVTMNTYKKVTANFTASTARYNLTITVNPAAGGSVALEPSQPGNGYLVNTVVKITATATGTDYVFSGWSGDLTGTTNPISITMSSAKSVTANFTATFSGGGGGGGGGGYYTISITVNPSNGGSVTLSPVQPSYGYTSGTTVTVTATANAGYTFSGWSGDLSGTSSPMTVTMYANKYITANFTATATPTPTPTPSPTPSPTPTGPPVTPSKFTLTVTRNPAAGGTVSLNPTPPADGYAAGTVVTITATASTDYTFSGWSGDLSGSTNPASITMNAAKTVTANFAAVSAPPNYWLWAAIAAGIIAVGLLVFFFVIRRRL